MSFSATMPMSRSSTSCSRQPSVVEPLHDKTKRNLSGENSWEKRLTMATTIDPQQAPFKPKKSVALSGTPAGNTALCTVGRTGNDLHYRGYDIADLAAHCEFEEVAYLLVHGKLPNTVELTEYKTRLGLLRSLPAVVKLALELLPPTTHPMDVLRTGVSMLGCVRPEAED